VRVLAVAGIVGLVASGCGSDDPAAYVPASVGGPTASVATSIQYRAVPLGGLNLAGVPEVSVPIVLSEYLNTAQVDVRHEVGDDIFGGAIANDADTAAMTITILGTDTYEIADAVSRLPSDAQDRIVVAESKYSVSEVEGFAAEARSRLDVAGIDAWVVIRWGLDAVSVNLVTPDGAPDATIESEARSALGDLPVVIDFSGPIVPRGG
jgi:hypothetical protein